VWWKVGGYASQTFPTWDELRSLKVQSITTFDVKLKPARLDND
jgi:hypothetical protein